MTHIIKLTNATKGGPEHIYLNTAHIVTFSRFKPFRMTEENTWVIMLADISHQVSESPEEVMQMINAGKYDNQAIAIKDTL